MPSSTDPDDAPRQFHALLRPPGRSYPHCLTRRVPRPEIDLALARAQHAVFARTIEELGVHPHVLDPLDTHPDSVFIEDTALLIDGRAICFPFAVRQRSGEEMAVAEALSRYMPVEHLPAGVAADGGDCILTRSELFVGVSQRSSAASVEALRERIPERRLRVVPLAPDLLHLKCAATYLGDDASGEPCFLVAPGQVDPAAFAGYRVLEVAPGEEDAANCLVLGRRLVMARGQAQTRRRLEQAGFEVVEVDLSELAKGDGSVTCLSLVWQTLVWQTPRT